MKESLLWHNREVHPLALGCTQCVLRSGCGGLHIKGAVFSCDDLCCHTPDTCASVCPANPIDFVAHLTQVNGWALETVPRCTRRVVEPPAVVPLLYGGNSRRNALPSAWVALPLGRLFDKSSGLPRYASRAELIDTFKIRDDARIVISGTDEDNVIERWWSNERRNTVLAWLAESGVDLVTTPNFSMFSNAPRPDHWYNAKRIALSWAEIVEAGVAAALHLNACDNELWKHWIDFVGQRPEIAHVCFEFGTGAGSSRRAPWHVEQLIRFARAVARPLHLTVRGGMGALRELTAAFHGVTFVDSSPYIRTMKRRIPMPAGNRQRWVPFRTDQGEDLSNLLWHAIEQHSLQLQALMVGARSTLPIEQDTEIKKPGTSESCDTYAHDTDGVSPEIIKT